MRQLSLLDEVKKAYQEHRSAFIPGATMQAILLALGARLEDFAKLQQVSGNLADDHAAFPQVQKRPLLFRLRSRPD